MKAQKHILTLLIVSTIAFPLSAIAQTPDPFKCFTADEIKDKPLIDYSPDTTVPSIHLKRLSTCRAGYFNSKGSEIVAYDPATKRLFVVNMAASVADRSSALDVIDIQDPLAPVRLFSIGLCDDLFGGKPIPTSVAVHAGLVALAVQPPESSDPPPSKILFYNAAMGTPSVQCPEPLQTLEVGYGADMIIFTPDGTRLLVANAADSPYLPGSVSIINLAAGWEHATVTDLNFNGVQIPSNVRIPPAPTTPAPPDWAARMLKPEYVAVSPDSLTAWVTLEVNNAMAVVDINSPKITDILPLGYKNYSAPTEGNKNKLDPSDRDGGIHINNWPVFGMYQPDAIVAYQPGNQTYLVTANEGGYFKFPNGTDERIRVGSLPLASNLLPYKANDKLGRLRVSSLQGDTNGDGKFEELYAFGARSFSIWSGNGQLVFDSAADFEEITAKTLVVGGNKYFNADDNDNDLDSKSDDQGPESDGVHIGKINGHYYAFPVLVRPGGIMVYDITDPQQPLFQQYINNRNFTIHPRNTCGANGTQESDACVHVGDLGPEGVLFIAAQDSPIEKPLLVVANQTSSSTTLYQINQCAPEVTSSQVSITRGGFRYNRATKRFVQVVTLKNTGSNSVQGPLWLVLYNLSQNATLANTTQFKTECIGPLGSPYIKPDIGTDNMLAPGESATVVLEFDNPGKQGITYNARLLAGENDR
ncbi:MAG: choice-of-anchor I family protein [Candidatus Competibacteraceae bacterium]